MNYAAGKTAALAKYAIEFKSPKMLQVLQGAMDKAFANGASPRFRQQGMMPFKHMPASGPANYRKVRDMLQASHNDGLATGSVRRLGNFMSLKDIPLEKQLEQFNSSPRTSVATPIGRPRENAIKAMLTRKLDDADHRSYNGRPAPVKNVTREIGNADPKPFQSTSLKQNPTMTLLNDLREARQGAMGPGGAVNAIDPWRLGPRGDNNADQLAQHAPQVSADLEKRLRKHSLP